MAVKKLIKKYIFAIVFLYLIFCLAAGLFFSLERARAEEKELQNVWVNQTEILPEGQKFMSILNQVHKDGLPRERYHTSTITGLIIQKYSTPLPDKKAIFLETIDFLLTDAFVRYLSDLNRGVFDYQEMEKRKLDNDVIEEKLQLLKEGRKEGNIFEIIADQRPRLQRYELLKQRLEHYRLLARKKEWPAIKYNGSLQEGDRAKEVADVRQRLMLEPGQERNLETDENNLFDEELKKAVEEFQQHWNLRETGLIDLQTVQALNISPEQIIKKIKLNLDRLRWLSVDENSHYVLANIPEFRLYVIKEEEVEMEMKTVVGSSDRQTPIFSDNIEKLIFNPVWYIPQSIVFEEYLPEAKKDVAYLEENHIRVYEINNGQAEEVNPHNIDWDKLNKDNFDYLLWQDSGHWNLLGNVIFRGTEYNPESIYLHDTPERHLFYQSRRAYSHGCVRLKEPLDLAFYLLNLDDDWDKDRLHNLISGNTETSIALEEPIPLYYAYLTAWIDGEGRLNIEPDIYERDQKLMEFWQESSLNSNKIDSLFWEEISYKRIF